MAQRCRFQACLTTDRAVAKVLGTMAEYFDDEANAAKDVDLRRFLGVFADNPKAPKPRAR